MCPPKWSLEVTDPEILDVTLKTQNGGNRR
jgi:hypothetical protein